MLDEPRWDVLSAASLEQALALLDDNAVAVVICERDLPDGYWRDLLCAPSRADQVPLLIVTSRLADEGLWVEVLHEGGFDVIPKPLCERDVRWVLASAWRQQQQQPAMRAANSRVERSRKAMYRKHGKRTRSNPSETVRPLVRQWAVLIATLALFGGLYLVVLAGG
jgi:DNA-binding response OmpR family regulator